MRTIGVAIPCYIYHLQKLKILLDSIQAQTLKPTHVVVSCSSTLPDNKDVNDIREKYTDFKLDVITTKERKNASENRNIASRHLHTDIISYMDADDIMHPQRLEYILQAFQQTDCQIVLHSYTNRIINTCVYPHIIYHYGKLASAPCRCAVHIDDYRLPIHHGHSSILKTVFDRVQYREESSFNRIPGVQGSGGCEDSVFCSDVLLDVHEKNVYIPLELSFYFEEGYTFVSKDE